MAKVTNAVIMTCDHCQRSECFPSNIHVENSAWDLDIMVGSDRMDLCPKCSSEWDKRVRSFLHEDSEEDIRVKKALEVAWRFSQCDGAHHKAWSIDQMVRALLGDNYTDWIEKYKHHDLDDPDDYYDWDVGIAP